MNNYFFSGNMMGNGASGSFFALMPLLVLWSIVWKGLALWHSAGRKQGWWFVALLVVNTLGILEIFYLFGMLKLKMNELFPKR
jgi:hypothetical protein